MEQWRNASSEYCEAQARKILPKLAQQLGLELPEVILGGRLAVQGPDLGASAGLERRQPPGRCQIAVGASIDRRLAASLCREPQPQLADSALLPYWREDVH